MVTTEFERSMLEVFKKWGGYIDEKVNGGVTPEPTPTPEPAPTPSAKEPEIIYNGMSSYIIGVGETITITMYGMNSTNSRDFACSENGAMGSMPIFVEKLKETSVDNGFRFDFTVTGKNAGNGSISMFPHKYVSDKSKYTTVQIKVR